MIGPLTYLDAGLLAVCFISGLLAMYRGLTRELLSILSWVVAGGAVLYFVLNHRAFAQEMANQMGVQNPAIAQIVIGAVLFLIVLIVVHLITARISDTILDSRVGMIDRVLGFLFGVARGFVLVVIPYMFAVHFMCKQSTAADFSQRCRQGELPFWVERAVSLPFLQSTSTAVLLLATRYLPSYTAPSGEQQSSTGPCYSRQIALALSPDNHI